MLPTYTCLTSSITYRVDKKYLNAMYVRLQKLIGENAASF